jgi:hypothetical protein
VHDNGQDGFQDAEHAPGTLVDLAWRDSWVYGGRENPLYPDRGYGFSGPQIGPDGADTGCTHVDGVQLFAGGLQRGLTFEHLVLGPLLNQGLYPGDARRGTRYEGVAVRDVLFLGASSHNLNADAPVAGWTLDRVTLFAPQGGLELPTRSGGANALTNSVKHGGYTHLPGWSGPLAGTIWSGGGPLPGAPQQDPRFARAPAGRDPRFAALRAADLTPTCAGCAGKGAALTSVQALLDRIDALNGRGP